MSLNQKEAEFKHQQRKRNFKRKNRYAGAMSDETAVKIALEDTRKALKWLEENPGKALPLGY